MITRWMRAPVLSLVLLAATASFARAEDGTENVDPYAGMDASDPRRNDGGYGAEGSPGECPQNVTGVNTGWNYTLFGYAERSVTTNGTVEVNAQYGIAGGSATVGRESQYTYNEGTYIGPNGIRISVNCATGFVTGRFA